MVKTITTQTVFWFTIQGKVSMDRPPARVEATAFRLEQLLDGKKFRHITGSLLGNNSDTYRNVHRRVGNYHAGIFLFLESGA